MKCCPACQNRYTDETLRFCLQDGTPLVDETAKQSSIDTIAFGNPLTAGSILRTEELNLNPQNNLDKTQSLKEISNNRITGQSEIRKSNLLSFASLGGLLVFAAVGIGSWFYFSNQNKTPAHNLVIGSTSPENLEKTLPANQPVSSENIVLEKTAQEQTNTNHEQIKKEITALVEEWRKLAESKDLSGYVSKYAETVDYHDKNGAKLAEVRNEIQKTFATYEQINISLTNIKVAVNEDGNKSTVVFDKDWEYENQKNLSEGKAHTKLHFQKNGEGWKITGERYLEIYDMEN